MAQHEIMQILIKNPNKFFDSETLSKLINVGKKNISRGMSILIKNSMVDKKIIQKSKINLPTRFIVEIRYKKLTEAN